MIDVTRRRFVANAAFALAATPHRPRRAAAQPASAGPAAAQLIEDLVAANRILVDQGVLDGYGHVSARHDREPGRYLMSRSRAPELVTAADIMEYDLDSEAARSRRRSGGDRSCSCAGTARWRWAPRSRRSPARWAARGSSGNRR